MCAPLPRCAVHRKTLLPQIVVQTNIEEKRSQQLFSRYYFLTQQAQTDITCFLCVHACMCVCVCKRGYLIPWNNSDKKHQHLVQTRRQPANPSHHLVKQEELGLEVIFLAQEGGSWLPSKTSSIQIVLEDDTWGKAKADLDRVYFQEKSHLV